jgi:hypothetical protein
LIKCRGGNIHSTDVDQLLVNRAAGDVLSRLIVVTKTADIGILFNRTGSTPPTPALPLHIAPFGTRLSPKKIRLCVMGAHMVSNFLLRSPKVNVRFPFSNSVDCRLKILNFSWLESFSNANHRDFHFRFLKMLAPVRFPVVSDLILQFLGGKK